MIFICFLQFFPFSHLILSEKRFILCKVTVDETVSAHYNRYISANETETDQVKFLFATALGEMYPVRLCLHILPDVLWHGGGGSWSDLSLGVWEVSGFFIFKFRILFNPAGSSQSIAGPETGLILQVHLFLSFRPRNPAKNRLFAFFLLFSEKRCKKTRMKESQ